MTDRESLFDDDDDLLRELFEVVDAEVGPTPPDLVEFAHAAGSWVSLDEELAELVAQDRVGQRNSSDDDVSTFQARDVAITFEVSTEYRLVTGVVRSQGSIRVTLQELGGSSQLSLDEHGRFQHELPSGAWRLRLVADRPVVTPWRFPRPN
jgi:hypothetical protein